MKKNNKGLTLLEMVIGILFTGVIVSAALTLYLTQHKQLLVQDDVSNIQSSIRAATEELTTRIRMAGYGIPENKDGIVAYDTNPDTIVLCSSTSCDVKISHSMPLTSSELRCDGYDVSCLNTGDTLYIYDPISKTGEYFFASHVQIVPAHIQHNTMDLSHCYPESSLIMRFDTFKYYIDNSNPDHPNLMVRTNNGTPQIYADNMTDLQFKYILSSQDTVDVPILSRMIREVMISATARTNERDPDFNNQYRTRTLSTKVKVRNLGIN